jgi:hypothetical protein
MEEIKKDLKEIRRDVTDIKTDVARNTVSLDHHIKRTALAEDRIMRLEYWMLGLLATILAGVVIRLIVL